jgi:hypothetical protein
MSQTETTAKKPDKFEALLARYKAAKTAANVNIEEVPVKVRPGHLVAKRTAEDELPGLFTAVKAAVIPSRLAGVFASGDPVAVEAMADLLRKNGDVVLDAGAFYNDLGAFAEAAMGNSRSREFNTVCFSRMMSSIRDSAQSFGIRLDGNPEYEEAICRDTAAVVAHVRQLVRGKYDDVFAVTTLSNAIVDAVVNGNLTDKRIPVLVLNASEEEQPAISQLFSRARAHEFEPGFEATPESVANIFRGR